MKAQYKMVFCLSDNGEKKIVLYKKHNPWSISTWWCVWVITDNGKESEYELTKRATDWLAETISKARKNNSWATQKPIYFTAEGERL